ncbi:hypothetical protein NFI96_005700 [Prochilodus magdalenae]|nr:hypothetical protein NFI96_005700 [Prochilodus magdalenae]
MWYKQRLEHAPLEVASVIKGKMPIYSNRSGKFKLTINSSVKGFSLSIKDVSKEDEGIYFCGAAGTNTLDFSTATFLAVTGQLDISVLQPPVQGPVSPGQPVTLQCTVLSEIRAADLRVLWFRAAAGQSFPEIIYTHQNSSSRQCEISSSTHCSVYNFSRNILNHHHTGTYYCAVAACGRIIFGNGTAVELSQAPVDPVTMTLAVFSAVCVAVICAQTIFIYKMRRSEHRAGGNVQERAVNERTTRQMAVYDLPDGNKSNRQCPGRVKFDQWYISPPDSSAGVSFPRRVALSGNFLMVSLTIALGVSIIVILAQATVICKWRNCGRCSEKLQLGAAKKNTIDQDRNAEILNYAPVHFKKKRTGSREKREQNDIVVYSQTLQEPWIFTRDSHLSRPSGEAVTLQCTLADPQSKEDVFWYKQPLGQMPQEVGITAAFMKAILSPRFQNSGFKLERIENSISLTIPHPTKDDEGMYYCGISLMKMIQFQWNLLICYRQIVSVRPPQYPRGATRPDPTQAVDVSAASFVSVESGQIITLLCKKVERSDHSSKIWVWYKQRTGQEPQEVAIKLGSKAPGTSSARFKIVQSFNLTIEQAIKDDEGMYFCAVGEGNTISFSNGTFLAVTGQPQLNISVLQTPVWGSVTPGEPVTLQCTVLPDLRAAGLPVLWFRDAAGQSFPEVIYTPQKTGSHQCEFSSSTNSCMYNFSISNFSQSDAGTYYCAVAACGRIIVGSGASVYLGGPVNPVVMFLGAVLVVCVFVISAQTFIICKWRNSGHCSVRNQQDTAAEKTTRQNLLILPCPFPQDHTAENLNYAAIHFKEKEPKAGRRTREQPEDVVYSHAPRRQVILMAGQLDISVLQTPVQGSVSPGEPVTLQCTVLSEIRAADLRVLWFRAAAGQSFPEIIYTHQNSSSRQCEISSSTHCSVYSFSRNILNHHHTGTYYCAVAACEKIIFGNGTAVELNHSHDLQFMLIVIMGVALVLSVMGNIWSWMSASCRGKSSQSVSNSFSDVLLDKDTYAKEFDVTALLFSEKMKRSALEENMFTRVSMCEKCFIFSELHLLWRTGSEKIGCQWTHGLIVSVLSRACVSHGVLLVCFQHCGSNIMDTMEMDCVLGFIELRKGGRCRKRLVPCVENVAESEAEGLGKRIVQVFVRVWICVYMCM